MSVTRATRQQASTAVKNGAPERILNPLPLKRWFFLSAADWRVAHSERSSSLTFFSIRSRTARNWSAGSSFGSGMSHSSHRFARTKEQPSSPQPIPSKCWKPSAPQRRGRCCKPSPREPPKPVSRAKQKQPWHGSRGGNRGPPGGGGLRVAAASRAPAAAGPTRLAGPTPRRRNAGRGVDSHERALCG